MLHTDEASVDRDWNGLAFEHETVNHIDREFVRGNVTTDGVGSVLALIRRGFVGVYHHAAGSALAAMSMSSRFG